MISTKIKTITQFGVALIATFGLAFAANEYFEGPVFFHKAKIQVDSSTTGNFGAATIANRTRRVNLPLGSFVLTATGAPILAASVPGAVIIHNIPAVEWDVGENTQKISTQFRVPSDYVSGATFVCMFSLEAASANTTVDFEIWTNRTGVAFDAATTDQTPVAIANATTTMQDISLVTATDTFAANDVVTLSINRAAGTGAGSLLELYNCALSYTADM